MTVSNLVQPQAERSRTVIVGRFEQSTSKPPITRIARRRRQGECRPDLPYLGIIAYPEIGQSRDIDGSEPAYLPRKQRKGIVSGVHTAIITLTTRTRLWVRHRTVARPPIVRYDLDAMLLKDLWPTPARTRRVARAPTMST